MTTRRKASTRAEEGIPNVGVHENQVPLQENQVPTLEQVPMDGQVFVFPPPVTDEEIISTFFNLDQGMTSEANSFISQVQAMPIQVNQKVGPHMPQHASTMASRLRDFTKMNPPTFFMSKEDKYPQ